MVEVMTTQIFSGNITKKSDAYSLFQIEPTKVDRVYDMLVKKGIAGPLWPQNQIVKILHFPYSLQTLVKNKTYLYNGITAQGVKGRK